MILAAQTHSILKPQPEFALAALCCRWPLSNPAERLIRDAVNNAINWDLFLCIARRHRILGLAAGALDSAGIVLPASVAQDLATRVKRVRRNRFKRATETVRLQNLLVGSGICVIVLKGAALEQLAYGPLTVKQTRDIDLLVAPAQARAALQVIESAGYALSPPGTKLNSTQCRALIRHGREIELFDPTKNLGVELQWRVTDNPLLLKGISAYSHTQSVTLSEAVTVRTLAPDDLFAYLCVHGARHSWSRLKWLADLNALLVSTNADIEQLYRHAQKIGAGLCAAQGLLLCQGLLGLRLPERLAAELEANKRHRKLVAIAMRAMTAPSAGSDRDPGIRDVLRELRNRFLLGQGLRFYLVECRMTLVGSADIVRLPLPRSLYFIYPLVRLPMWLWRRIKIAVITAPAPGMK
jgi:putative nucleotidyltransferase-like protein